jgi:hypothetical protein
MTNHALLLSLMLLPLSGCAMETATDEDVYAVASEELTSVGAPRSRRPLSFGRDMTEQANGVPIRPRSQNRNRNARPIYVVRIDDVADGERVRLRGQVMVSRCNRKDIDGRSSDADSTPCTHREMRQHPYGYAPRINAAFVVSSDRNGGGGRRVSDWFTMSCTESRHHCALSLPEVVVTDLHPADRRFVKLVVTATGPDAQVRNGHVVEVEQHRGGLYVTRELPGLTEMRAREETAPRHGRWMGIDQTEDEGDDTLVRRQIFRVKLRGLEAGDVIDVDARMRAQIRTADPSCDPLINTHVFLSRRKKAREPHGRPDITIAARNGTNCANHSESCVYEASGAARVPAGAPSRMWVTLVAYSKKSCAAPHGADTWRARRRGSHFRVRVRSADPDRRRTRSAAIPVDTTDVIPLSRYWNAALTDHYYTTERNDYGAAIFGYEYEGSEGQLFADRETGTVPMHQFWCGDAREDHFYTLAESEAETVEASGCDYEGIAGYAFPTARPGAVALHRYLGPTDHFYTLTRDDPTLALFGYAYEGVAAWVQP